MKIFFKIYLVFILQVISGIFIYAQEEWKVPSENKEKLSPFEFNETTAKAGQTIFENNCKVCHGTPGMNNFQHLTPEPGDPAGIKFQKNTDGEIFYKVNEGRATMPSFRQQLSPEDIWNVISYIRSFNKEYVQQVAKEVTKKGYTGDIKILLTYLQDEHQIKAKVTGSKENTTENLAGVGIKLQAERRFGNLPLDVAKTTNSEGNAYFTIPEDLPGDSSGNIKLISQLSDIELFGKISQDTLIAAGIPTRLPGLTAKRAMWNKFRMAPLWVLITYFSGVTLAWGVILYILFQLRKIFYIGKEEAGSTT